MQIQYHKNNRDSKGGPEGTHLVKKHARCRSLGQKSVIAAFLLCVGARPRTGRLGQPGYSGVSVPRQAARLIELPPSLSKTRSRTPNACPTEKARHCCGVRPLYALIVVGSFLDYSVHRSCNYYYQFCNSSPILKIVQHTEYTFLFLLCTHTELRPLPLRQTRRLPLLHRDARRSGPSSLRGRVAAAAPGPQDMGDDLGTRARRREAGPRRHFAESRDW